MVNPVPASAVSPNREADDELGGEVDRPRAALHSIDGARCARARRDGVEGVARRRRGLVFDGIDLQVGRRLLDSHGHLLVVSPDGTVVVVRLFREGHRSRIGHGAPGSRPAPLAHGAGAATAPESAPPGPDSIAAASARRLVSGAWVTAPHPSTHSAAAAEARTHMRLRLHARCLSRTPVFSGGCGDGRHEANVICKEARSFASSSSRMGERRRPWRRASHVRRLANFSRLDRMTVVM
jgi:hypothetical protein